MAWWIYKDYFRDFSSRLRTENHRGQRPRWGSEEKPCVSIWQPHKMILTIALAVWLPSMAFAMTPGQVYEAVKDSVVVVKVYDRQGKPVGLGSGVMLPSGDIITNYHVVKTGVRYTVGRGKHVAPATLKAGDPDKDLCLLTAPGLVAEPARLGKAAKLKVGDPVYAVGAPQGLELSLSEGIVSQLRGRPSIQSSRPRWRSPRAPAAAACSTRKGNWWALPPFT